MRTPRHLDVEVTGRCNLRCRYCYRGGPGSGAPGGGTGRELSTEGWRRFFAEAGECAVMTVALAGGEPFLRPDLPELLAAVRANGMRFQVLSNGGLIDDRAAAAVAEGGRCDFVQISLDGGNAAVHDRMRGEGSFAAAVRGVRTLQRAGVKVTVRLTVHRANVGALGEAVRFALEELGVSSVSTNSAAALGSCAGERPRGGEGDEDVVLGLHDRERAMSELLELAERYGNRLTASAGPLADARMWSRMVAARRGGEAPFPEGGRLTGCGCAFEQLAVRSDGVYIPCLLLPAIELGRVGRDPLRKVWAEAPALQEMRRRREVALADLPGCAGCGYLPYCTGNCPAVVVSAGLGLETAASDGCLRLFVEAGGRVPGSIPSLPSPR